MKNLSKDYGYYGGVSKANHYVPPPQPDFVPHPPSNALMSNAVLSTLETVIFTDFFKSFLSANAGSIVFRKHIKTDNIPTLSDVRVFELNTQNDVKDTLTYDTMLTGLDLGRMDGGMF
jgi:hypothetical protein